MPRPRTLSAWPAVLVGPFPRCWSVCPFPLRVAGRSVCAGAQCGVDRSGPVGKHRYCFGGLPLLPPACSVSGCCDCCSGSAGGHYRRHGSPSRPLLACPVRCCCDLCSGPVGPGTPVCLWLSSASCLSPGDCCHHPFLPCSACRVVGSYLWGVVCFVSSLLSSGTMSDMSLPSRGACSFVLCRCQDQFVVLILLFLCPVCVVAHCVGVSLVPLVGHFRGIDQCIDLFACIALFSSSGSLSSKTNWNPK